MAYKNGEVTISPSREYTVICEICNRELVDWQRTKRAAENHFRRRGWGKRAKRWHCPEHLGVTHGTD